MPVTPALGRLKQGDHEFQINLSYTIVLEHLPGMYTGFDPQDQRKIKSIILTTG
jgi:hypothetical protein